MSEMITEADLQAATERFYTALDASLHGDPEPINALWSDADDACYMGPMGQMIVGSEAIREDWRAFAATRLGGRVEPSDLHFQPGGDIGVVTGWEEGIDHRDMPASVRMRATSTYRLEDGEIRLIGHHTDLINP